MSKINVESGFESLQIVKPKNKIIVPKSWGRIHDARLKYTYLKGYTLIKDFIWLLISSKN